MADRKTAAKTARAKPAPAVAAAKTERATSAPAAAAKVAVRKAKAPQLAAAEEMPQLPSPKMVAAKEINNVAEAVAEASSTTNERMTEMQTETTNTINETARTLNDRTQAMFGDLNGRARETMDRSTRVVEEMADLTRGNVEALVASSKVAARGFETLGQEVAEFSRRSFEEASTAVRNFAEVRSATDLFRLQSEFARTAFDSMVSETSKMSEAMIKLAGEVAEPITSRYSVAAERVKNIAA